jgi:hypothetical protein
MRDFEIDSSVIGNRGLRAYGRCIAMTWSEISESGDVMRGIAHSDYGGTP